MNLDWIIHALPLVEGRALRVEGDGRVLAGVRNFKLQISDFIFGNLRFAVCNPDGNAFDSPGSPLTLHSVVTFSLIMNNPG